MSIVSIEIKKGGAENSASVLRRFTRKVQEAGILQKVKGNRYAKRSSSKLSSKKSALKRIERGVEFARLEKLGKITARKRR